MSAAPAPAIGAARLLRVGAVMLGLALLGGLALWTGNWALSLIGLMLVSFAILAFLFVAVAALRGRWRAK